MTRSILISSLAALSIACGPMEVEVSNETGADLVLDMPEQVEVIPPGTSTFVYKGAPAFNKRWTIPIRVDGDYVVTSLSLDATRDAPTPLSFGSGDVNAFVVEFDNGTGERIDSLFVQHPDEGALSDGQRPGTNYGPLAPGDSVTFSLEHRGSGYHFVYYQQGEGTVDTSGQLNTEAPGQDLLLSL